jgi:sugar phosphate isomerase/epimerase
MESEGLVSTGLHWLLRAPGGMHITTPDTTLRKKSWEYLRGLIELAADLGDDPVMVLGSGRQRGTTDGSTVDEAKARLAEGFTSLVPTLEATGVKILMEPLAPHLCNVVNTLGEAVEIVRQVNSPGVQTLFDVHNAAAEPLSHDLAIKKYRQYIKYVQINEMDGGYPGSANYDFKTMLKAFQEIGYDGWISMEVFNLTPGAETIATESINHIRRQMAEL